MNLKNVLLENLSTQIGFEAYFHLSITNVLNWGQFDIKLAKQTPFTVLAGPASMLTTVVLPNKRVNSIITPPI